MHSVKCGCDGMVDMLVLETSAERCVGSTPFIRTNWGRGKIG